MGQAGGVGVRGKDVVRVGLLGSWKVVGRDGGGWRERRVGTREGGMDGEWRGRKSGDDDGIHLNAKFQIFGNVHQKNEG